MTPIRLKLTRAQAQRLLEAINVALAGPYNDGDYCWTASEANAAARAREILIAALYVRSKERNNHTNSKAR